MNLVTATSVTDEATRVHLSDTGSVVVRFAKGALFDVVLAPSMTPEAKAAWCRDLARQLTAVAADVEVQAPVTA